MRAALGLPRSGYVTDDRLVEIAFGEWEGLTYTQVMARDRDVVARRESQKWEFQPPGGESYKQLAVRIGDWYRGIGRDTVVAAHGGTARALIAYLGMVPPDAATHYSIDQRVVYVFAAGGVARYT
jgi:probable phosphoglycerate mutase